jgi:hypothetical protein
MQRDAQLLRLCLDTKYFLVNAHCESTILFFTPFHYPKAATRVGARFGPGFENVMKSMLLKGSEQIGFGRVNRSAMRKCRCLPYNDRPVSDASLSPMRVCARACACACTHSGARKNLMFADHRLRG